MNMNEANVIALAAAKVAAQDFIDLRGDMFTCGFSWVYVDVDGRSKIASQLKEIGFEKSYKRGYDLWNPSKMNCQSIDALLDGSRAYCKTMNDLLGVDIFNARSRVD
jgi:hypothetical protein